MFQGRVESWNNEREIGTLGNLLEDDEEGGHLGGARKESEQKNSGQSRQDESKTATADEVFVKKKKKESYKTVGRKGWAQNGREQQRFKSNFGEAGTLSDQVGESTRNIEAAVEVPFKDPRISGRHGRKGVYEDKSKEEETVDEESEIGFHVTVTQRGRKAWLNERRRKQ